MIITRRNDDSIAKHCSGIRPWKKMPTKDTWKRDLEKKCGQDTAEEDGGGSTR